MSSVLFCLLVFSAISKDRLREVHAHAACTRTPSCPNIVGYYGAWLDADSYLYLQLEWCEGGSAASRQQEPGFTDRDLLALCADICNVRLCILCGSPTQHYHTCRCCLCCLSASERECHWLSFIVFTFLTVVSTRVFLWYVFCPSLSLRRSITCTACPWHTWTSSQPTFSVRGVCTSSLTMAALECSLLTHNNR